MNLPLQPGKAKSPESVDLEHSDVDIEIPPTSSWSSVDDSSRSRSIRKSWTKSAVRGLAALTVKERRDEIGKLYVKLEERLKKALQKKKQDDKAADNVQIEANGKTKYELLVSVMDACIRPATAGRLHPPPDWRPLAALRSVHGMIHYRPNRGTIPGRA